MYKQLISEEKIMDRIDEIAAEITQKYKGKNVLFICALKGAFLFFSELIKRLEFDLEVDFMSISSYVGKESKDIKFIDKDFSHIAGKEVVIVDDILDTGKTLNFMINYIKQFNPNSIETVTLLKRKTLNEFNVKTLAYGFEIDDEFVVGFGLDHDQKARNLRFIGVVE